MNSDDERAQRAQRAHTDGGVRTPEAPTGALQSVTEVVDFLAGFGAAALAVAGARFYGVALTTETLVVFGVVLYGGSLLFGAVVDT